MVVINNITYIIIKYYHSTNSRKLIELDSRIDLMDETGSANVTNGSTKHTKCNTEETHVAKIENSLEESVHPENMI